MMDTRLKKLAELAHMIKETELARLSKLETARQDLATKSATVRAKRRQAFPTSEPDAAFLSGASELWQIWCSDQLTALSAREARAAADVEEQKRTAVKAFGRSSVLSGLVLRKLSEKRRY